MICEHGGYIYSQKGLIDFSANISPFGLSERIIDAVVSSADSWVNYPDPFCGELREKIGAYENMGAENIVCGNGAADIIFRIVHAFKPRKALVCYPSFSEYSKALSEWGSEITGYYLREEDDFAVGEELIRRIREQHTDMIFLCSPNNPTGKLIPEKILERIAEICKDRDIILVCDECFMDLTVSREKHTLKNHINSRCIILKAFTKLFAMPGLRLGYALCGSGELAERLSASGQYWSVSSPAQAAGMAALEIQHDMEKLPAYISRQREYLYSRMDSMGIRYYRSDGNFILFRSRDDLGELLLKRDILIRDCSNFKGLSRGYYRIAVRTHEENRLLTDNMEEVLNG